jgi:Tfp pilus assembly protein FimT
MATYKLSELDMWAKKIGTRADSIINKVCFGMSEAVIEKTPVWRGEGIRGGTAKGNWQPTLHAQAQGVLDFQDEDGTATIQKAKEVSNNAAGNVFYLTNNLSYIRVLEYGLYSQGAYKTERTKGGYSIQAPKGMVRIAAREFSRVAKEQINKFK